MATARGPLSRSSATAPPVGVAQAQMVRSIAGAAAAEDTAAAGYFMPSLRFTILISMVDSTAWTVK